MRNRSLMMMCATLLGVAACSNDNSGPNKRVSADGKITDGRATVVQKRRELQEAKATHDKTLADLAAARTQAVAERDAAERELTQRFVTAGTILNLNRVDHPALQPLFARIDELKNGVNAREAAIVRLESERRLYDRSAVQKGLLAVGIAAGVVIILLIVLIVLIKR